jgi:hypothetical protein
VNRLVWLMTLALSVSAAAQTKGGKQEKRPEAGVSWEGQLLKATGSGAPDMKASNPAQARLGAERAAKLDAFRNLLEQARGVQVSAGRTVADEMEKDEVRARVESVIKGFRVTNKRYYSDSGVELDVEVPLSALTSALLPRGENAIVLKREGAPTHTGLVVDARGLKASPALAPRLVNEAGAPLYAADVLTDEARSTTGVAGYAKTLEEARKVERVGANPLVVRAARAEGTDLVLAAEDAKKLTENNNAYLAEGRVVIVTQ